MNSFELLLFTSYLVIGILLFGISLFVFLNSKHSKTNKIFSLYSITIAWWGFFSSLMIISDSLENADFWNRLQLLGVCFIPATFLHFIYLFLNLETKKRVFIIFTYILSISFCSMSFSNLFISRIGPVYFVKYFSQPGIVYYVFIVYFFFSSFLGIYELIKSLRASVLFVKDRATLFLIISSFLGYLGGFLNFGMVLRIPFTYPMVPFGNLMVAFYGLMVAYIILKYKFLNIEVLIRKSIVYSTLIGILTLVYLFFIYLIESFAQGIFGYQTFYLKIFTAFLVGSLLFPIRNVIHNLIDRVLFKGTQIEIAEQNEFLRREVGEKEKFRAIATLISGIAHEIKNPMTSLKTFIDFLPQKKNDPDFMKKFEDITGRELNRIDRLTRQLLEFAKPSAPDLKPTVIENLIENTLALIRPEAVNKKVEIVTDFKTTNTILNVDGQQIQQAVLNLCLNAIDAMVGGGVLKISTDVTPGVNRNLTAMSTPGVTHRLIISVTDTGCGISPDKIKNLFNPFYTTKENGTGLGLMITKEIVEKHKGKIDVKSEVGKGTEFVITLPVGKI